MLRFNAGSLQNIIDELRTLITSENIDIVVVTDTFIDTVNNDLLFEYKKERLRLFNRNRIKRRGSVHYMWQHGLI